MEAKPHKGTISAWELAILTGRDRQGLDWDDAVAFADGWYAAHAGWAHNPHPGSNGRSGGTGRVVAYDLGFVDGGGDVADPFDAARRANLAALRRDNAPRPAILAVNARPLPSQWPKPADAAHPAS